MNIPNQGSQIKMESLEEDTESPTTKEQATPERLRSPRKQERDKIKFKKIVTMPARPRRHTSDVHAIGLIGIKDRAEGYKDSSFD